MKLEEYNTFEEKAPFFINGDSKIDLIINETPIVKPIEFHSSNEWKTVTHATKLKKGPNTIRVKIAKGTVSFKSIIFYRLK